MKLLDDLDGLEAIALQAKNENQFHYKTQLKARAFRNDVTPETVLDLITALRKAVEALEFYGNEKNYDVSISGQCPIFDDADNYPKNARFGARARATLKEIGVIE